MRKNMIDTGLPEEILGKIIDIIMESGKVEQAILYGSRAKGSHKRFSDIDITLKGETLEREDLYPILHRIDDLCLPYEIDLSIYHLLDYGPLIEDIERHGIKLAASARH